MKPNSNLFSNTYYSKKLETLKKEQQKENNEQYYSNLSQEEQRLVKEVKDRGDKISEKNVVFIIKNKNGKIIWLEKGKLDSGLIHIKKEHAANFNDKGIPTSLIPTVLMNAIKEAKIVGTSGVNRDVYETTINGKTVHIAITISNNGYIVGAHPVSQWKEKK